MQGSAPAMRSHHQSAQVLVLLVNSPVHRLFRLSTNTIIASSNTLPRRSQQFHVNTQIACALAQRRHALHPLERPLRKRLNHMGSRKGAMVSYISKSKHLSRSRIDVCSLSETNQGLWGLTVVCRSQCAHELLLTGVSLRRRPREQLIVARDSVKGSNVRQHPQRRSSIELFCTSYSIICTVPLLDRPLLHVPWPAEVLHGTRDRSCDVCASVPQH